MDEYYFEISLDYRVDITVKAENEQEALKLAREQMAKRDVGDGGDWWVHWSGLFDEQGVLMDEALV